MLHPALQLVYSAFDVDSLRVGDALRASLTGKAYEDGWMVYEGRINNEDAFLSYVLRTREMTSHRSARRDLRFDQGILLFTKLTSLPYASGSLNYERGRCLLGEVGLL